MIVTTRRSDINRTGRVFAVVCSTVFQEPIESDEVLLPHEPHGQGVTRLKETTVAVCNWTISLSVDQIVKTGGLVPTTLLREICEKANITYVAER